MELEVVLHYVVPFLTKEDHFRSDEMLCPCNPLRVVGEEKGGRLDILIRWATQGVEY